MGLKRDNSTMKDNKNKSKYLCSFSENKKRKYSQSFDENKFVIEEKISTDF